MKFLFILPRFNRSGATRVTTEVVNGLADRGHEVVFLVPKVEDEPFYPISRAVYLKRPVVPLPSLGERNGSGGLLRRIAILSALEPADVAVVTPHLDSFLLLVSARLAGIRRKMYFSMCYEPLSAGDLAANFKKARKIVAGLSYHLPMIRVCDSEAVSKLIAKNHGVNFPVANPGVDTTVFRPQKSTVRGPRVRIMTFGSGETRRDFGVFRAAMDEVFRKRSNIEVWILSRDGMSHSAPYPVDVVHAPRDSDLARLYSASDIFVSTSFWEGYGLPPLEAMACGTACVITDSGGVRDYARHKENCLLVPPRSPVAVAQAVISLIDDPDLRERLACAGPATAREFTWDSMVTKIERIAGIIEPTKR